MERNYKYDYAKLFLIICVVFGHLGNRYAASSAAVAAVQFWLYLFHMPGFVFIAGLFSKRTVDEKRWGKFIPYIFLYLFMEMFTYVFWGILRGFENVAVDFFNEGGVPWYAFAMVWWYLLTILVRKVHPAYVLTASVILSVISGYSTEIGSFLVMQRTIIFFPIFYLGYVLDPQKLSRALSGWAVKITGFVLLAGTLVISRLKIGDLAVWRSLFRGQTAYANIGVDMSFGWGWLWRLAAYAISMILVFAVIAVMPSKKSFICYWGKRTLACYVFHNLVISVMVALIPGFNAWMKDSHVFIKCIIFTAFLVLFTTLPVFDRFVKLIMNVPARKNGNK